jgi:hypothetical protein
MITYAHKDDPTCRFTQYAKDPIPKWAVDVQPAVNGYAVAEYLDKDLIVLDEYLDKALVRICGRSNLPPHIAEKIRTLYTYTIS